MISDEEAKKFGKEVTDQHPLAVYGMAKASTQIGSGYTISSSMVTAVRVDGCELRVTLCRGDLCEMKQPFYKFSTPLSSTADLGDRMLEIRAKSCAPNPIWLVTDPLAFLILVVCSLLAYGTYIGVDNMVDAILRAPRIESVLVGVFGSSRNFANLVVGSFWFSVVAHAFEATITVYYANTVLKLGLLPTSIWAVLVFSVGYPIFNRFQKLAAIEKAHEKSK